jgi:formate dehydrogenase
MRTLLRLHGADGVDMAKILCVLYDDPVTGYPKSYPRAGLPKIERYPDGQTLPTPKGIDFTPGTLLGSVSGELGLRKYLEANGHQLIVTASKDGADSVLDRELPDTEIVISQPFWPAYMTAALVRTTPICRRPWIAGSPLPKSPTATATVWPSTS